MTAIPKKFGFIRTTLALWAADLFPGRAGVVTDAPMGSSTSEAWGWWDGAAWKYAAKRGGSEEFGTLTLNGATRPAWALWDAPIQLSRLVSIYTITGTGGQVGFARNFYVNSAGEKRAIVSGTGTAYPSQFHVDDNGRFRFYASQTDPVAGAVVTDANLRFEVNRFGGIGVFGVAAPIVRPTVNAACTDLATCIALTNQLRAAMVACGLVQ